MYSLSLTGHTTAMGSIDLKKRKPKWASKYHEPTRARTTRV